MKIKQKNKRKIMKKIIYLSIILMFSVSLVNASSIKETVKKDTKVEITKVEIIKKVNGVFLIKYKGKCLDGHTFYFYQENREEAQGFVNDFCKLRRDFQIIDIEDSETN
jgi:hypothetical protein|tara:strand:+ start:856 stop:1182 length:327 start_codon:yes stop_codon:yes gene_type:complete